MTDYTRYPRRCCQQSQTGCLRVCYTHWAKLENEVTVWTPNHPRPPRLCLTALSCQTHIQTLPCAAEGYATASLLYSSHTHTEKNDTRLAVLQKIWRATIDQQDTGSKRIFPRCHRNKLISTLANDWGQHHAALDAPQHSEIHFSRIIVMIKIRNDSRSKQHCLQVLRARWLNLCII
jgi:hypothetical protein